MSTLFELAAEYQNAAEQLEESGFDAQTIADTLEGLSGDLEQKAINIAKMIRNLEAEEDAIRKAIDDMVKRANATESRAQGLREYLKIGLQQSGVRKISCPWFVISLRENIPHVIIDAPDMLADRFMIFPDPPAPRPDKRAIAAAFRSGETVSGARMERGMRVEIR